MCLKMQNEKNSQKQPTIKFNKGEKDNMDNISIFSSSYGLSDLYHNKKFIKTLKFLWKSCII